MELPEHVRALMHDCDPERLSWDEYSGFLVDRVLSAGGWDAIQWLRGERGDEALRLRVLDLADRLDIAAMKLAAVPQRGARKDFHDIVAIARAGTDPRAMLEAYSEKFSVRELAHVLTSLTWFDEADRDPEPVSGADVSWSDVKQQLRSWVKQLAG